jgi:hypothetical protein
MNSTRQGKLPAPKHGPPGAVRARPEAKKPGEWRPEHPNIGRTELRRIVIAMIG